MLKCDHCFGVALEDSAALMAHWKAISNLLCLKCGERFLAPNNHCFKCEIKSDDANTNSLGLGVPVTQNDAPTTPTNAIPSMTAVDFDSTIPNNRSSHSSISPTKLEPRLPTHCLTSTSTQTAIYKCDECVAIFDTEAELQSHLENSPFHVPQPIECYECDVKFQNSLGFHIHHNSKPHKTRLALCVV